MKVLVTGANGFVGQYLVSKLLSNGHIVIAAVRADSSIKVRCRNIHITRINLLDINNLTSIINRYSPDAIIHLAAMSNIPDSWDYPVETIQTNVIGTMNLLEVVSTTKPYIKIITVGSGEEYGKTANDIKCLVEDDPCQPQNPYAISKFTISQLGGILAKKRNLQLIHVRPFNHFGPGQSRRFVVSDFSYQIMKIEKGLSSPYIKVGNIENKRDFTDVRDIVNAYYELLISPVLPGIYNICTGKSISVNRILDILMDISTHKGIKIIQDDTKRRTNDITDYYGSNIKLKNTISWKPQFSIESSLKETLQWWHQNYQKE